MASAPPRSTIASIQYLRGIAALMVVMVHLQLQRERLGAPSADLSIMSAGVEIFFVISGFIMWVTTATRPDRTAGEFMRDRVIRIVPIYWIVTGTMLAALLIAPRLSETAIVRPWHTLASFLFVPAVSPATGGYAPLLIPGWSLNYEMAFYLLFALAIWLGGKRMGIRAALILGTLAVAVAIGQALEPGGVPGFYTASIILHFCVGVVIGMIFMSCAVPRQDAWWLLSLAGFAMIAIIGVYGSPFPGALLVATAAIVFGAAHVAVRRPYMPLLKLGDWSYSLYLTHPLALSAFYQAVALLRPDMPLWLFSVLALVLCIAVSGACFTMLEQPITRWLKARSGPRRAAEPAVALAEVPAAPVAGARPS